MKFAFFQQVGNSDIRLFNRVAGGAGSSQNVSQKGMTLSLIMPMTPGIQIYHLPDF